MLIKPWKYTGGWAGGPFGGPKNTYSTEWINYEASLNEFDEESIHHPITNKVIPLNKFKFYASCMLEYREELFSDKYKKTLNLKINLN